MTSGDHRCFCLHGSLLVRKVKCFYLWLFQYKDRYINIIPKTFFFFFNLKVQLLKEMKTLPWAPKRVSNGQVGPSEKQTLELHP